MKHLMGVLSQIYNLWMEMGVYLIFGFAVAGLLSRVIKSETVARHLGGNSFLSVVKASLFGVPLPLCSCGVIPVGLSLFKRGASRGATTSFLISTPQTGVDSIVVTYGLLGPLGLVFAVVRPIAAFMNGLLGGAVVNWLDALEEKKTGLNPGLTSGGALGADTRPPERLGFWGNTRKGFQYAFLEFPQEIVTWLLIGIVAAGVVAYLLPPDSGFLTKHLGSGFVPMLVMAMVGIPFYICATASVPFVAVLLAAGLSPGAGLVFLMTGPATNTATLILLSRVLGKRTAAVYLGSIVATSFAFGFLLDWWFALRGGVPPFRVGHFHDQRSWLQIAGGVGLLLIVGYSLWEKARAFLYFRKKEAVMSGEIHELLVNGMTCENCARHVSRAAESAAGVESATVDLERNLLKVSGSSPDLAAVRAAVKAAGYQVVESLS
jgi:uncharacterized membrane protein YraQ (UPF0718 family)/copper chaperone CopZ